MRLITLRSSTFSSPDSFNSVILYIFDAGIRLLNVPASTFSVIEVSSSAKEGATPQKKISATSKSCFLSVIVFISCYFFYCYNYLLADLNISSFISANRSSSYISIHPRCLLMSGQKRQVPHHFRTLLNKSWRSDRFLSLFRL